MTEICAACLFNEDIKLFKEIIVKEIRVLFNYHHENQSNKKKSHRHVLRTIFEEILCCTFVIIIIFIILGAMKKSVY